MQHVQSEDHTWTSRTLKSAHSDVEVTLLPAGSWNFFIYLNSRGYYVMPLMICIPFLLFPAWLSIRIAMRPWNKVVDEISLRTPDDLSPLKAVPRHRELRQTVDAINDFLAEVRESAEREKCLLPMPLTNCVRLWPRCGSTSRHCSPGHQRKPAGTACGHCSQQ